MRHLLRLLLCGVLVAVGAKALAAQDSTAGRRVAIGLTYSPGTRPGMIVVGGPGLDSVQRIIERDLSYSDHYDRAFVPDSVNSALLTVDALKGLGVKWGVMLASVAGGVQVRLFNLNTGEKLQEVTRTLDLKGEGEGRLSIHQVSDEIQGWTAEGKGIAASRIMLKIKRGDDDRLWRIDSDGQNLVPITRAGPLYITPAWAPDGERIAYSERTDGSWILWVQNLRTGTRNRVQSRDNTFPAFSPDGKQLAFVRDGEKGANILTVDVSGTICCESVLNQTRFADNNRPAYSHDGSRIAFVTNRAGSRQIWVMDKDGSLPSALIIPEQGTGNAGAPAWAPDGSAVAYAQDVSGGGRQVSLYSIGSGRTRVLTGQGLNDYPSWAPDSRHIVLKTTRQGREQLLILDTVTSTTRLLVTPGSATYPAWSPALGATNH